MGIFGGHPGIFNWRPLALNFECPCCALLRKQPTEKKIEKPKVLWNFKGLYGGSVSSCAARKVEMRIGRAAPAP